MLPIPLSMFREGGMRLLRAREGKRLQDHGGERDDFLTRSISYANGWRWSPAQQRRALPITEAIAGFSRAYAATVLGYLRSLPEDALDPVARALSGAIAADGSTLHIFGNGGSHAIARHLEYALRVRFSGLHGVRINCGVDYHSAQMHAVAGGYDSIFEAVLRSGRVSPGDLAVFISGSGDSDNLLHAAAFCRSEGIQSLSFAGFDGGKISRLQVTDVPFVVRVPDQQIAEDIIQAVLRVAVDLAYERCVGNGGSAQEAIASYSLCLKGSLDRVDAGLTERVSAS